MAHHMELSCLRDVRTCATNDYFVRDTDESSEATCFEEIYQFLLDGEYQQMLRTQFVEDILKTTGNDISSLSKDILDNVQKIISQDEEDDRKLYFRQCSLLAVAVGCLQLFVQNNWTGPPTEFSEDAFLSATLLNKEKELLDEIKESFTMEGDPIYSQTSHILCLYIARLILQQCQQQLTLCQTWQWWLLRLIQCHQALLSERSPSLKSLTMHLIEQVSKKDFISTKADYRDLSVLFYMEAANLCNFFYESKAAKQYLEEAHKRSGLSVELTGMLGRRTRFQETDLAQLVLKVEKTEDVGSYVESPSKLPKNIPLDDDTVLNALKLKDNEDKKDDLIGPVQQALVLAMCLHRRRNQEGQGSIVQEEALAYTNYVLSQPQTWVAESQALLLRTQWEWHSVRRLERAMAQLEELVAQYKRPEPAAIHRLPLVYTLNPPPRWDIERQLGAMFEKVQAVSAALEVYLRLEMWEDVIKCYYVLGKKGKAESLIREQLAVKETPSLWCYLGDVLKEAEPYEKAWELSGGHYGRAQRSLGYLHMSRQEYEKALPCFEKSVRINALQVGVWFTYGCAALACSQYTVATQAFRTCVNLDSDNFQAWNNLSSAYIKLNQKSRALTTLQEALKCEYENWRVWENYLLVATDVGHFSEVIRAYHRMLDLREKHTDTQVLGVLVKAVVEGIPGKSGESASLLKPKALELLGRLTSQVTNDGEVWRLYSKLLRGSSGEISETDQERALQYSQKSLRCVTQADNWERDMDKCKEVLERTMKLAQEFLACGRRLENAERAAQLLAGGRLAVKGVLAKVKQAQTDPMTGEMSAEIQEPYTALDNVMVEVLQLIEQRKS